LSVVEPQAHKSPAVASQAKDFMEPKMTSQASEHQFAPHGWVIEGDSPWWLPGGRERGPSGAWALATGLFLAAASSGRALAVAPRCPTRSVNVSSQGAGWFLKVRSLRCSGRKEQSCLDSS
jgi:hypothetical protein